MAIADRQYDEAIDLLRMNYRLGENVAQSPLLVCSLIGLAICGTANVELAELVAAPDSPNLYWAIAELPRPLVDMRTVLRLELSMFRQRSPGPRSPRRGPAHSGAVGGTVGFVH